MPRSLNGRHLPLKGVAELELKVVIGDATAIEADALIVNLFEGVSQPGGATGAVDRALGGAITELIAVGEIKGKLGENTLIHTLGRIPAKRIIVAGLGKQSELTLDRIRRATAEACRYARGKGAKKVATIVHGAGMGGIEAEEPPRLSLRAASWGFTPSAGISPRSRSTDR